MNRSFSFAVVALFVTVGCSTGQAIQSGTASPGVGGSGQSLTPDATTIKPSQGPAQSPTPAASAALSEGALAAGTYVVTPFDEGASYLGMRFAVTLPDGWAGAPFQSIWLANEGNGPPDGAGLVFETGGGLHRDPCEDGQALYIPIGPTVADFVGAVAKHPLLDTTTPIDVELAGHSGRYFDLQVPADISTCDVYRPWEWLYAQGPSHRWHVWVLDVDGVRVVVQSTDYAGTSTQRQAELKSIVASIKIQT